MSTNTDPIPIDPETTTLLIASAAALLALAVAIPVAATWLYDGTLPHQPLPRLAVDTIQVAKDGHWSDPARAYPPEVAAHLPAARGFWQATLMLLALLGSAAYAIWQRRDVARARHHLGRRPHDPRGSKPRDWARPRDLRDLQVHAPQPDRFTLGTLAKRLIASDWQAHVALIAPTRSGKTTGYVIPWLLEHDGPAIVTSTKTDVLTATHERRAKLGSVFVWDPFAEHSVRWDPVAGCDNWTVALQQARWLADASEVGDSEIAKYWSGEAAKLLAPLLHAAAVDRSRSIDDVRRWLDSQDTSQPTAILTAYDAQPAIEQLTGTAALDERNRGSTYMSAGSVLAAYRYPDIANRDRATIEPADIAGTTNTLYVIARERHQRLLAPLVVAFVATILDHVADRANAGEPQRPTLRVLLDEAANIAPLRELPALLSQAAGHGVRFATVWQSLGQLHERYPHAADTILANSTTKLFMGPVTDERTWKYLGGLLDDHETDTHTETTRAAESSRAITTGIAWRPKAPPAALQQLQPGRALLIAGARPPAVLMSPRVAGARARGVMTVPPGRL